VAEAITKKGRNIRTYQSLFNGIMITVNWIVVGDWSLK
jgi:hypothetical protein